MSRLVRLVCAICLTGPVTVIAAGAAWAANQPSACEVGVFTNVFDDDAEQIGSQIKEGSDVDIVVTVTGPEPIEKVKVFVDVDGNGTFEEGSDFGIGTDVGEEDAEFPTLEDAGPNQYQVNVTLKGGATCSTTFVVVPFSQWPPPGELAVVQQSSAQALAEYAATYKAQLLKRADRASAVGGPPAATAAWLDTISVADDTGTVAEQPATAVVVNRDEATGDNSLLLAGVVAVAAAVFWLTLLGRSRATRN